MLSKKIEFNFSKFLKKKEKEDPRRKLDIKGKGVTRHKVLSDVDLQTKIKGFGIGFFVNLALGALIISIAFVIP